uniref:DNAJ heat shock N-terminal domain-containing protein n=1 Tax=Solanum tuberosum TaxID=4113 RepID=M1DQ86_SOLTU
MKRGLYKIFSRKGEVRAVYKNWSAQLKGNNLEDFEYEIVEIVDVSDNYVDMKFLEWAKGFKSVHKARVEEEEEADSVVKTSVSQHLMFSNRIPGFRLIAERVGSLPGFWELDPAGIPLFFTVYKLNKSN